MIKKWVDLFFEVNGIVFMMGKVMKRFVFFCFFVWEENS